MMQGTNHGAVIEEGNTPGLAVWSEFQHPERKFAVFAVVDADSEMSKQAHGPAYVRPLPESIIDFLVPSNQRYVRFEPLEEKTFGDLCKQSLRYGGMACVISPATITDENAVATLQDLWDRSRAINRRLNSRRPLSHILERRPILHEWVFCAGLCFDTALTFFLSMQEQNVRATAQRALSNPYGKVIEQW